MSEDEEKRNDLVWKVFLWALGVLVSIAITSIITLWRGQNDINNRLIAIESNRCTALDCSTLRHSLSNLQAGFAQIPEESLPRWFVEKVNAIEREVVELQRRGMVAPRKDKN